MKTDGMTKLFFSFLFTLMIPSLIVLGNQRGNINKEDENKLTEYQILRALLSQSELKLIQCQMININHDRTMLENQFRETMKPSDDKVFDWNTLTFK